MLRKELLSSDVKAIAQFFQHPNSLFTIANLSFKCSQKFSLV